MLLSDQNLPWFASQSERDAFITMKWAGVFISGERAPLKIGWTQFPDRITDCIHFIVWVSSSWGAQRLVKEVACLLEGQHLRDYMFDVTSETAKQTIKQAAERMNVNTYSHKQLLGRVRRLSLQREEQILRGFQRHGFPLASM